MILEAQRSAGEGCARALAPVHAHELRAGPACSRTTLDFQDRLDAWTDKANDRVHRTIRAVPAERLAEERTRMRPLPARMPDLDRRRVIRVPQQPFLRVDRNDYSIDPAFAGRRVEVRVSQTEITAVVLDTGELACPPPARVRRRPDVHRPGASDASWSVSASSAACATRSRSRSGRWPRYDALIPA